VSLLLLLLGAELDSSDSFFLAPAIAQPVSNITPGSYKMNPAVTQHTACV